MTTKKNRPKRAELESRALAIVADVREYDYDARLAIAEALKDKSLRAEDLAGMLAQAEAGEIVEHPLDAISEDLHARAHTALRVMESGVPDFLLDGMMAAVNAAARHFRIEVWKRFPKKLEPSEDYDGMGYSARALAELFRVGGSFSADLIPWPTLAESIAAVLADEGIPQPLYDAMADALGRMHEDSGIYHDPRAIAAALDYHAQKTAEEKGGGDEK